VKAFGDNFVMKQLGRGFVKVGGAETDPEDIRMVEAAWDERARHPLRRLDMSCSTNQLRYRLRLLDPAKVRRDAQAAPEMVHVILTPQRTP